MNSSPFSRWNKETLADQSTKKVSVGKLLLCHISSPIWYFSEKLNMAFRRGKGEMEQGKSSTAWKGSLVITLGMLLIGEAL